MATKPLKTIKFPGLADTYTVPQVDNTLTTSGAAADAKKTGDEISDIKNDLASSLITDTATGAIASFPDGSANAMESLIVNIEPVQDLNGYANPWPAGGGKNLLNINGSYVTRDGVIGTYTVSDDAITVQSTTIGSCYCGFIVPVTVGSTYTLSYTTTSSKVRVAQLDGEITKITSEYGTEVTSGTAITAEKAYFLINFIAGSTAVTYTQPQLESGSTATSYAPYSNICPISGWTQVKTNVCGKNLLKLPTYSEIKTYPASSNYYHVPIKAKKGVTYYLNTTYINNYTPSNMYVLVSPTVDMSGWMAIATGSGKRDGSVTAVDDYIYLHVGATTDAEWSELVENTQTQLEVGSTVTSYVAYNTDSQTVTTQLGQTVYGGTLDVVSGSGQNTMDIVDLGSFTWAYNSNGYMYSTTAPSGIKAPTSTATLANIICSHFASKTALSIYGGEFGIGVDDIGKLRVKYDGMSTDPATFKTAVTGVQLCYELATPTTSTVTGQTVESLYGDNNVFADAGNVTVIYKADTKLYINKVLNA